MKLLVVALIVLLLVGAYLYLRLRPYIKMARQIFGAARGARGVGVGEGPADLPRREPGRAAQQLVKCAGCDAWVPDSRAVRPGRSGAPYCSHDCLERAAAGRGRSHKSAS